MFNPPSVTSIHATAKRFGVPIPKALQTADEVHDAAIALLEGIRAPQPAPDALTVDNLRDVHAAMVAAAQGPLHEQIAGEIEGRARTERLMAWTDAADYFLEKLRKPFDDAAARFTEALEALNGELDPERAIHEGQAELHKQMTDAANDLAALAGCRNTLAVERPTGEVNHHVDELGRVLTLANFLAVAQSIPIRTGSHGRYTAGWWAAVTSVPGCRIQWHTPAEQQTYHDLAKVGA